MKTAKPYQRRLYSPDHVSTLQKLLVRALIVIALIASVVAVFMWDRDGLQDQIDGEVSNIDVLYFTSVTLTTVGYGDIIPITDRAKIINAVFVTPIRLFIWFIFLGTAYELFVQKIVEDYRLKRLQQNLADHVVVCGFGFSGHTAADEIVSSGTPSNQVLVIDKNEEALHNVVQAGFLGLRGSAVDRETLNDAQIGKAKAIIISLGRDDTNVLAVLTVRQMSEDVKIICTVRQEENATLLEQAGANVVVAPSRLSGYLLADAVKHSHVSDYIADLLTHMGRVHLVERMPRPDEIGEKLRDVGDGLGVRIIRDKTSIGFWEAEKTSIQFGDVLLIIQPLDSAKAE
jgi:voltage-gated potassium channel